MVAFLVLEALGGVLIGTALIEHVPGHWLRKVFAVFMVIVTVRMFMMPPKRGPTRADQTDNNSADVLKVKGSSDG